MTQKPHYTMIIQWSDEDSAYLVSFPDWEERIFGDNAVVTHGETYEEAVRNGEEALKALIGWAEQEGLPLPTPRVHTIA